MSSFGIAHIKGFVLEWLVISGGLSVAVLLSVGTASGNARELIIVWRARSQSPAWSACVREGYSV